VVFVPDNIMKIKKQRKLVTTIWPQFTKKELDDFGEFLNGFMVERETKDFKTGETIKVKMIDFDEAMVKFGAMVKKRDGERFYYAIAVPQLNLADEHSDVRQPNRFELFNYQLQCLRERDSKKQYAQEKQMKEYEQMVEQGQIVKEFPE